MSSDKAALKGAGSREHAWASLQRRLETGELKRLAEGPVAREIKLAEQYDLHRHGDVARRLHPTGAHGTAAQASRVAGHGYGGGHPPAGHAAAVHHWPLDHQRGWIHASYWRDCFRFHHYGSWYPARHCWYPHWSHWVDWSWHYHCGVIWDPRPIYCRPIVYAPAPVWVYWDYPVWNPLPVVSCGTWVDVPQVVVAEQYDLQLLAVRFVDAGHPEQDLGPRYRVWFRNNSRQPITQPFDVMIFASLDGRLVEGLPQAGVRVAAIEAGETQAVDVRLPLEVAEMGRDAEGNPIPFATLHVLVDAGRQINETSIADNGADVAAAEILPVDPASFEARPSTAPAGGEILLAGEGFGPEPGRVLLHLGDVEMEAEILGWYDLGVRLILPGLPLAGSTTAELIVVRGDGVAANPLSITVTPPARAPEIIPTPPAPPE